jgi:hypothetical protein
MIEYVTLKKSLPEAVERAYSEFQMLGEEMREAFDEMGEKAQEGPKGQATEETADLLEQLDEPSVPKLLEEIEVTWQERTMTSKSTSRADRRDAAITVLEGVIDALDKKLQEIEEIADTVDGKLEQTNEVESFREDIGNLIDNASSIEFPRR